MSQDTFAVNHAAQASAGVDPIVRLKEFLRLTGLGRSTVYKLIGQGDLDRPLRISARSIGWRQSTVSAWLNSRNSAN